MKNLENYGVQEMNAKEVISVDGGLFGDYIDGLLSDAADTALSFTAGVLSYAFDTQYQTYNPAPNGCLSA